MYWITGLSGVGKTTLAKALYEELSHKHQNIVLLDGDILRENIAYDLGYTKKDRLLAANRYARLSKMLAQEGLIVIIATISMFDSVRSYNRENIQDYREIYLRADIEYLKHQNTKNIYSKKNVAGVDLEVEEPKNPDLIIESTAKKDICTWISLILAKWGC